MNTGQIEEIEKNLNFVWDRSHNRFKLKVHGKSYAEAVITFRQHIRKKEYVQACGIASSFFEEYQIALIQDEADKLVAKEMFNTLKEVLKNAIGNN